jgi:hypothetical protein
MGFVTRNELAQTNRLSAAPPATRGAHVLRAGTATGRALAVLYDLLQLAPLEVQSPFGDINQKESEVYLLRYN